MDSRIKIVRDWVDIGFSDWINSEKISSHRLTHMIVKEKEIIKKVLFDKEFNKYLKEGMKL